MTISLTIRQKEILTGLSILLVILAGLLGGEMMVRIQQFVTFGTAAPVEKMDTFYIDEETGLRLAVPGARMGKVHINSQGYRGAEIPEIPAAKVIRVAYLGSSITFDAYSTSYEKTWPHLTTNALKELYPNCQFDYFNAGLPGVSSSQLPTYYREIFVKSSPHIVIIMTDDRARLLDQLAKSGGIHDGVHHAPSWLAEHSLFWAKVEKNAVIEQRTRAAESEKGKLQFTKDQLVSNYKNSIRELTKSIKKQGAIPILLSFGQKIRRGQSLEAKLAAVNTSIFFTPYISLEGFLKSADWYNQANAELASELELTYLSWHEKMPGIDEYFIDSRHFNSTGSARLAKVLQAEFGTSETFRGQIMSRFSCAH